jgi:hypothetical protein
MWRLQVAEVRAVLSLRSDFDPKQIARLNL